MATCYIVSLKYAAGLAKEFFALGERLAEHGHEPVYLLTREYEWLVPPFVEAHYPVKRSDRRATMGDLLRLPFRPLPVDVSERWLRHPPAFLCFYNFHPLNMRLAMLARRLHGRGVRAVFFHEPYVKEKLRVFGAKGAVTVAAVERLQKMILSSCNHVILPSENASDQFDMLMPGFSGRRHLAPLLVPDRPGPPRLRSCIGFYGRMDNRNKGLGDFGRIVEWAARHSPDLRFRILTGTNIRKWYNSLSRVARDFLACDQRDKLSDADINEAMQESLAVLLLHRHISQSGVLPVAYLNGTPVIARDLAGFRQHVTDGETGRLVAPDATPEAWVEAVRWVAENHEGLGPACRRRYEEEFSPKNWESNYSWLLEELSVMAIARSSKHSSPAAEESDG